MGTAGRNERETGSWGTRNVTAQEESKAKRGPRIQMGLVKAAKRGMRVGSEEEGGWGQIRRRDHKGGSKVQRGQKRKGDGRGEEQRKDGHRS